VADFVERLADGVLSYAAIQAALIGRDVSQDELRIARVPSAAKIEPR
jgi:hypothetical protein